MTNRLPPLRRLTLRRKRGAEDWRKAAEEWERAMFAVMSQAAEEGATATAELARDEMALIGK